MIDNLSSLSAYVCVSLLRKRPLCGHDGVVESNMTRLKRGVRYCNLLNGHEAYYRALVDASLLSSFQAVSDAMYSINFSSKDIKQSIEHCEKQAEYHDNLASRQVDQAKVKQHLEDADDYLRKAEGYRILNRVSADATKILSDMPKNKSGNIEWKDLKSVQFYGYNPQTNSFVEINEKGERV